MDYKKRFLLNDLVKGERTSNYEFVEGRFNGFHLYNKLDPTSVVGVICVEGDRCYDVVPGSIELLESKDERIIKGLIQHLEILRGWTPGDPSPIKVKEHYDAWLAWLEKQSEILESIKHKEAMLDCQTCANYENECFPDRNIFKCSYPIKYSGKKPQDVDEKEGEEKPTDKVEPKLNVGDWITNGEYTWKVIDIKPLDYILQSQDGYAVYDTISYVDEEFHLWTIQDAKDGDVLVGNYDNCKKPWIGIFKCISKDRPTTQFDSYCFLNSSHHIFTTPLSSDFYNQCKGHTIRYALPATKEQRELLFSKMKEAGYEWDAEKKELIKIEQKTSWSEEDEDALDIAIRIIQNGGDNCAGILDSDKALNWLKSLKEKIKGE